MCGIAGYIGRSPPDARACARTLATMSRRGPDDSGQRELDVGPWRCVLLHTRLAIIDPDPRSAQPFEIDGRVMIYNGEIYNYLELRETLIGLGHVFRTDSDTEVLLRAYLEWGDAAFDRLEGMWALAIADPADGTVLLSRDRFGEKPLLTHQTDHGLYFASEVKQLVALTGRQFPVRTAAVGDFLAHGYRRIFRRPETFFDGVSRFPSGHCARMSGDGLSAPAPYWTPGFTPMEMTQEEAAEGAMAEIDRAIRIRLRADVPIAISLSGGIDSNVLAGIAVHRHGQQLHTFSMLEQDSDYDESAAIRTAQRSLGVPAHETRVSHDGFLDRLAVMSRAYDGPVPSLGMYLDGFLSEAVAAEGYKVLINGNGADEIFAGYYDHYLFWLAGRAAEAEVDFDALVAEWRQSFGRHVRNPLLQNPRAFIDAPGERGHLHLNAPDVADYLIGHRVGETFPETDYGPDLLRSRMLNELMSESVPVLTWAHDSHYMHHSIENRAAYLDRGLVDFMARVPSRHLIQGGFSKALLRRAGEGLVPTEILHKTQKLGFNAPIASLLDRRDGQVRERLLTQSAFWDLVDRDKVRRLLDPETESRGRDNFLFCLVSARLFYEEFVD
ncbi:MAG: asparagine synthase (glutamine-hydrolyzing) [Alphaproteobacteria bacterium]|nr:asparagine synthase (glutamine-hydrolyzing) [Alphaproteobacteria bacterium]